MNSRRISMASLLLMVCCLAAAGANPFAGSWLRNNERSKASGQQPRDLVVIRTYEEQDGKMLHTLVYTSAQGAGYIFAALKYDGAEYPVYTPQSLGRYLSAGFKPPASLSITRLDANSFRYTDRQNGKISAIGVCTVSGDGNTLTEAVTNFDREGKEIFRVTTIYDKQR